MTTLLQKAISDDSDVRAKHFSWLLQLETTIESIGSSSISATTPLFNGVTAGAGRRGSCGRSALNFPPPL